MYDLKKWDAYIKHWGCGPLKFCDMALSRARHARLAKTNWYAVGAEAKHMHVDYAVASILVGNYPLPLDFFWEPVRTAIKQTINERYEHRHVTSAN